MFFLIGTTHNNSIVQSGDFFCPECSDYKNFDLNLVKQYFHIFFIPLIPLDEKGEYVECKSCSGTFPKDVLDYDPEKERQDFATHFLTTSIAVMVKISLADGEIDDSEKEAIISLYEGITGKRIEKSLLESFIKVEQEGKHQIEEFVKQMAPMLNDHSKEIVLRSAIAVSQADGFVHEEEYKLVQELSKNLILPKAYTNGIFEEEGFEIRRKIGFN